MYTYFNILRLTTAFLAYCMKNGVKNHLLKLKKRQKKMNKIRIFDGFECLLAFMLMSVHNYVRSFNVRPNKVR